MRRRYDFKCRFSGEAIAFGALMLLSIGFHSYGIGRIPIGMDYDQVREAYQASELFGHFDVVVDNLLFLHLFSLGLFQKVFGLTVLSNHLNGTFWFAMALFPIYWLSKDLFGTSAARWGLVLLSYSIIGFTAPRIGHIAIITPFFAFLSLWAFYRVIRTEAYRYAMLLGVSLGLGIYSAPPFKAIGIIFLMAFVGLFLLTHSLSLRKFGTSAYLGLLGKLGVSGGIALATAWYVPYLLAGYVMTFQRLYFVLVGYRSNGRFVENFAEIFRNIRQIFSYALPVKYALYHHFLIPHVTGSSKAIFYISPVISLFFLLFWGCFIYGLIRIGHACFRHSWRSAFSTPISSMADDRSLRLFTFWRKEYDWLFAACVFFGACTPALLSDHTAARRWIYGWFWMYPLAAAGLVTVCRKRPGWVMKSLLAIALLSQIVLVAKPYLMSPWRTQGPTSSVYEEMGRYCEKGFQVYASPILYHWTKHYAKLFPSIPCSIREFLPDTALPASAVLFDIRNNYDPIRFQGDSSPTITQDTNQKLLITEFSDSWGFHDFIVMKPL